LIPESATAEHLAAMTEAGVSRISVGVQTLEPAAANGLGRRLTSPDELATIRSSWNGALSADLIHAAPGETVSGLLHGIDLLVDLGFDHLSVYGLGVEPGTRLAHRVASGEVVAPVPEDGWRSIVARIGSHGLRRYEVSNFARPGAECRHNLAYWRGDGYLGLGPSAVSTLELDSGVVRLTQPTDHAAYFARRSFFDCDHEVLGASEQRLERLLLGLRTFHGVDLASIGSSLDDRARARLDLAVGREIDGGLLRADGSTIYPTERGLDLLDRVVAGLAAAF